MDSRKKDTKLKNETFILVYLALSRSKGKSTIPVNLFSNPPKSLILISFLISNHYRRSLVLWQDLCTSKAQIYNKILLLQKFNCTLRKVLKPKKFSLQPQKKMRLFFTFWLCLMTVVYLDPKFLIFKKLYKQKQSTKSNTMAQSKLFWFLFYIKMPPHLEI